MTDELTTSDAMQVMLIVQACHQRTAPRMDDRDVVTITAGIWAELFNAYRLTLTDLIAGVKKRALTHAEAPEPAEIIHFAREIRRDRSERETTAQRQERENRRDAELDRRTLRSITGTVGNTIGRSVGDA